MRTRNLAMLGIVLLLVACEPGVPTATPPPTRAGQASPTIDPSRTPRPSVPALLSPTITPAPPPLTSAPGPPSPAPLPTTRPPETSQDLGAPYPTAQPADTPDDSGLSAAIDAYLMALTDGNLFSGAVLVARDGVVVLAEGYGPADRRTGEPNTPQTRFRIGSITKQFTAMAILILQQEGELDVQDPVCDHLPDCPAAWQRTTLHHLLTHTSGIPNFVHLPGFQVTKATPTTPEELVSRFSDEALEFEPGTSWRYSNSGYALLGYIIERTSGQAYGDFVEENIFDPLGMGDSGYDYNREMRTRGYVGGGANPREAGYIDVSVPYAAGALYSTVEDLLRWDQALYGEDLVSQELLEAMFTPFAESPQGAYGYGWIISVERNRKLVRHSGAGDGFQSLIARYPDEGVTVILLSNRQATDAGSIGSTIAEEVFQAFP